MKSLKTKITLAIVIICVLLGAILGIYSIQTSSNAMKSNMQEELQALALQVEKVVENKMDAKFMYLEALAKNEMVCSPTADDLARKKYLLGLAGELDGVKDIGYAGADGQTLTSDLVRIADISKRPYFLSAIKGERAVSDPIEDSVNPGVMIMQYAIPVYYNDQITGVLYMLCDANILSVVTNEVTLGKSGTAYIMNGEGTNVANQDFDKVVNQENAIVQFANDPKFADMIKSLKYMLDNDQGYDSYVYNGVEKSVGFSGIKGTNWKVVVTIPNSEILAGMYSTRNGILIITLICLIIFSAIAYFLMNMMLKPVIQVKQELDRIAGGDYTQEIPQKLLKIKDETGELAKALENMQNSTKEIMLLISQETDAVDNSVDEQEQQVSSLMGAVEDVTATTEELSASSEETAASAQEMSVATGKAKEAVEVIKESAKAGSKTAEEISKRASELKESSRQAQKNAEDKHSSAMVTLKQAIEESKEVNAITELTNSILDITSQTNLLALNASIEAARAGEVGKGFAVVATEIGKLADDSQKSANQIKEVTEKVLDCVANLSSCATDTLDFLDGTVMEDYKKMVDTGDQYDRDAEQISGIMEEFNKKTGELYTNITKVMGMITNIGTTSQEIASGITNIAQNSSDITEKTSIILNSSQSTAATSEKLRQIVAKFKI